MARKRQRYIFGMEGAEEFTKKLRKLRDVDAQRISLKALNQGTQQIAMAIRREVPKGETKQLKKDIARALATAKRHRSAGKAGVYAGMPTNKRHTKYAPTQAAGSAGPRYTKAGKHTGMVSGDAFVKRGKQRGKQAAISKVKTVTEKEIKKVSQKEWSKRRQRWFGK